MNKKKIINSVFEWVRTFAMAFVIALIVNNFLIAHAKVISPSMESTIMTNSRVFGSRLAYVVNEPERFDIILFDFPDDESSLPFIKRVIGLPNEKVEIINGKVYIDDSGIPLDDSFIKEFSSGDYGPFIVPEDSYFVLGDNRNNSWDSRHWTNKFVSKDQVLGKLLVEYFPSPKLLK